MCIMKDVGNDLQLWPVARHSLSAEERGKFLKKLWCYVCERKKQGSLVLSTELIT